MNKLTKCVLAAGIAFSCVTTTSLTQPTTADASVSVKKAFPKKFKRTWYAYNKKEKKYEKITFYNGGKMSSRGCYDGKCTTSKPTRVKIFYYSEVKNGLWNVKGINQNAGAGTYYKVGTKKINGKKYKVLKTYSGAMADFDSYYYTKKMKR